MNLTTIKREVRIEPLDTSDPAVAAALERVEQAMRWQREAMEKAMFAPPGCSYPTAQPLYNPRGPSVGLRALGMLNFSAS
jgi:hypothetical protein